MEHDHKSEQEYNPDVLHYWFLDHVPKNDMLYLDAYKKQCVFFRDVIGPALIDNYCYKKNINVISTHKSKSVLLPVIELLTFNNNLRIIIRDNFYNYKISVFSKYPIDTDFHGIVRCQENSHYVYFEGFDRNWVRPAYRPGMKEFSVELYTEHELYMFVRILRSTFERKQANEQCEPFLVRHRSPSFATVYFMPSVHIGGKAIHEKLEQQCKSFITNGQEENCNVKYLTLDFSDCQMISKEWMKFINDHIVTDDTKVTGLRNELRGQAEVQNCMKLLELSITTSDK